MIRTRITNISVSVKDDECDSKYSYIYLRLRYTAQLGTTGSSNVLRFENHSGCTGGYKVKNTPSYTFDKTINSITVMVCRSDALDDTCYQSNDYANPNV